MHLKKYLENQRQKMLEYKWYKGQEIGCDPGEAACTEWVQKYAKQYRDEYNELYEKIITTVTESVSADIQAAVCACQQQPELVRTITEKVIEEFTREWIDEKLADPDNPHLDEI